MMSKRLFLFLAVPVLLLLPFADCMSAVGQDQQTMKCCASMPCGPSNQSQDCCKKMAGAHPSNMLPVKYVSLHGPSVAAVEYEPMLEIVGSSTVPPVTIEAQQHSPPELYTLHASLLI